MPLVQVPKNIQPRQIEFGEEVERSKPGALYFVPGTIKKITNDEFKWIQKNHKRFSLLLKIISISEKKSRLALKREAEAAKKPVVKRPKDNMSKAKQRQAKLLENKKSNKSAVTGAPLAPISPPKVEEINNNASHDSDVVNKKKKK